jgi:hypothetical protein
VKTLSDVENEVDQLVDKLGNPIDKNIKQVVVALRYSGFNTTASCEGHLDHGFPYPWVDIRYKDSKSRENKKRRLSKYIKQFYKTRESTHPLFLQDFADFRLQNVKWPRSAQKRKSHEEPRSQRLLVEYQKEMNEFTIFLLSIQSEDHRSI